MAILAVNGILAGCASGRGDGVPTVEIPQQIYEPQEGASGKVVVPRRARAVRGPSNCCKGMNECKGKGSCKTQKNDCKGRNDCKGLGGCRSDGCER